MTRPALRLRPRSSWSPARVPCMLAAELVTRAMLPADVPASWRQRPDEPPGGLLPDRQLGDTSRQARRVLDGHVLDIDARLARSLEEPGKLAGPVGDDYLDYRVVRG